MTEVKVAAEAKTAAKFSLTDKLPTLIAVTTLVLAVCATLASFKAAGYGNRMVLMQSQASDQWAYYQAKSIKETAYQVQRDMMLLQLPQSGQPEAYKQKIASYDNEIARYKKEKNDIQKEAEKLEAERDIARNFNGMFGQSLIYLQVGILLSSLASINKVPYYWYMGASVGVIGIFSFAFALVKSL